MKAAILVLGLLLVVSISNAAVIHSEQKSIQLQSLDGAKIQINFKSETIATPGSSAVNTSASHIQIKVQLSQNCEKAEENMKAKLHGVTTDGAEIIEIVNLRKTTDCELAGAAVYSLRTSAINSGVPMVYLQTFEIRSELFNMSLSE